MGLVTINYFSINQWYLQQPLHQFIMSSDIYVAKFKVKDKKIYLKLHWKENENELFQIYILDDGKCWSGWYSNEFAKKYRKLTEQTTEEYNENVKKCLSGEDNSYVFEFTGVKNDSDSAIFSWKKKFDGALLVCGSVPVHIDNDLLIRYSVIDFLLDENVKLNQTVKQLEYKADIVQKDLMKCQEEMEQFIKIKATLETSLYGKFIQLLNAKKTRMQILDGSVIEQNDNAILTSELD